MHALPIILLAAGASSRMRGRDKLLETVDGMPLIARQARLARAATSGPVIVTLPPLPHPRQDAIAGLDVTSVEVTDAATGINASIRTGIAGLPPDSPAAMILLADMPDLTANDLATLLHAVDLDSDTLIWRAADAAGTPGHPIIFSAALFPALSRLTGDSGARDVVAEAGTAVAHVTLPDSDPRADLDTAEDWDRWHKR